MYVTDERTDGQKQRLLPLPYRRVYNNLSSTETTGQQMYTDSSITNQMLRRSGVDRIVRTMRAPLIGGLEYIGRMRIFSCDIARWASSGDEQTNVKAPTRSPEKSILQCFKTA